MPTAAATNRRTADAVSHEVLNAAMKVHSLLGPGLLESTYQACLAQELRNRGFTVRTEVPLPVVYEGTKLEIGYRIDLLVDELVIVEIKSIDAIAPIHEAQVLTYLRLSGKSLALLLNFSVLHMKDGIKRFVMGTGWR